MYPKTIARVGIKLIGVFVLISGASVLLGRLQPTLISVVYGGGLSLAEILLRLPYPLMAGATTIVLGLYFVFGGGRLAGFITPDNRRRCPECGYRLVGLTGERCPECATYLAGLGGQGEPSLGALAQKPCVRVLVRLFGLYLVLMKLDQFVWESWRFATILVRGANTELLWDRLVELSDLLTVCLGVSLLLGGRWLVNLILPTRRPAQTGETPPTDLAPNAPSGDAALVRTLTRLWGLSLLLVGMEWSCRVAGWFIYGLVIINHVYPWILYLATLLMPAVKLGVGAYLVAGGRWLMDRALAPANRTPAAPIPHPRLGHSNGGTSAVGFAAPPTLGSPVARGLVILLGVGCLAGGVAQCSWTGLCLVEACLHWGWRSSSSPDELMKAIVAALQAILGLCLLFRSDWVLRRLLPSDSVQRGSPSPVQRSRDWLALTLVLLGIHFCVDSSTGLVLESHWLIYSMMHPIHCLPVGKALIKLAVPLTPTLAGVCMLLWSAWLARVILPPHRSHCADCGYELPGAACEVCPECDAPRSPDPAQQPSQT